MTRWISLIIPLLALCSCSKKNADSPSDTIFFNGNGIWYYCQNFVDNIDSTYYLLDKVSRVDTAVRFEFIKYYKRSDCPMMITADYRCTYDFDEKNNTLVAKGQELLRPCNFVQSCVRNPFAQGTSMVQWHFNFIDEETVQFSADSIFSRVRRHNYRIIFKRDPPEWARKTVTNIGNR